MHHLPLRLILRGSKIKISHWFWERNGSAHGLMIVSILYTLYAIRYVLTTGDLKPLVLAVLIITMAGCFLVTGIAYAHSAALHTKEPIKQRSDVYEAILRAHSDMGEAFIIIDKQKIIYANEAAETITGYTEAELRSLPSFLLVVVPDQRQIIANRLLKRLSGDEVEEHYETALTTKDGKRIELEVAIKTFVVQGSIRLAVLARDITDRKTADEARGEFVSWIAHQLRTPVTTANWNVEALCNGEQCDLSSEQKETLDNIYDANQQMLGLINDLLHMTKLELGTFQIDPEPVNVPEIASEICKQLSPLIKKKNVDLKQNYAKKMSLIEIDPNVIQIILQNLLSNALKYTDDGGKIEIDVHREEDKLLITISDTGCGIPAKDQSKIFEKYFRSSNAKKIEGTGLGLYIVRSVVEQSGGEVKMTSQEGEGTTVTVVLPEKGE